MNKPVLPGLSVCMIVKNEQKVLGRCLSSVRGIADQIVVVDTGSEDETRAIASRFGAEVHEYVWGNDFAAARNESIKFARHIWVLWLDADDVVPQSSIAQLESLKKVTPDRVLAFTVRNQKPGNTGSEFVQARMFPNDLRLHFEGRIHEQIMPSALRNGMRMEKHPVVIEHHGYADSLQLKEKARRNLTLLLQDYDPADPQPVTIIEIADSYTILEEDDTAADWYTKLLDLPDIGSRFPFLATQALMGLGNRANSTGAYNEAINFFEQALRLYPDRPDVLYGLAISFEMTGRTDRAIQALHRVTEIQSMPVQVGVDFRLTSVKAYLRLLRLLWRVGDLRRLEQIASRALSQSGQRPDIINAAATAYIQLGRFMDALHLFEDSLKIAQRGNIDAYIGLCVIYQKAGRQPLITQTLDAVLPVFQGNPRYWAARIVLTNFPSDKIPQTIPDAALQEEITLLKETYGDEQATL